MNLSVHLLYPAYDEVMLSRLRAELHPDIRLSAGPELPHPADCDILVAGRPSRAQIAASTALRALVVPWAGLAESTRELMQEFPHISVHNLHHNAQPVAELAIALLLAAAKHIVPLDRALRAQDWRPRYQPSQTVLLAGKTALILGFGAIGRRVAQLCQGLGMEVQAIRRQADSSEIIGSGLSSLRSLEDLRDLLPRADALIICLPLTPETTGLIGADELALLPPQTILVNVGRGPIVDEQALYQALRERAICAAGLDVWYSYPSDESARACTPPSRFPFHELDNVVLSPHRAGSSTDTEMLRIEHLAALLNSAARGESMPNRVDLETGY